MPLDPHEIRMGAGASAAAMLEALDDEALALMDATQESVQALTEHLRANGLDSMKILQVLIAGALAAAFDT
jgi:predicted O-methyltransferase YrrM